MIVIQYIIYVEALEAVSIRCFFYLEQQQRWNRREQWNNSELIFRMAITHWIANERLVLKGNIEDQQEKCNEINWHLSFNNFIIIIYCY